jgi:hypothetical protein
MTHFLETEKQRQTAFKLAAPYFTPAARADGVYAGRPRPFCLPAEQAEENLFPGIRDAALDYFTGCGIKWHQALPPAGGPHWRPSNHMCDSQVGCVNFLFPFAGHPEALAELLRPLFPGLRRMLPIEAPNQYVACELIGAQNYLGERIARGGKRTRGAHFTSADAAVLFEAGDGTRQAVLIEWKYTESYSPIDIHIAASGTDRTAIYRHLYEAAGFPLRKDLLPDFEALFYEPFYQLMRLQLLANEMEKAHELGADRVSLLHIAPAHNRNFPRVTSPALEPIGATVTGVWQRLVKQPDRFTGVSTERLYRAFPAERFPALAPWWEYITARYPWVLER